ncbi:MAG: DUF4097 domain-containing protein [Vicinamibacterales bacterium]
MAIMKKFAALVVAFGVPAAAAAGQARVEAPSAIHVTERAYGRSQGATQSEPYTKVFRTGPAAVLDLGNIAGDIFVTGGRTDEISLSAVKRARDRGGRTAKEQMDLVTIEAVEAGGRVEVRTRYPREARNVNVSVDFTVNVPSRATVIVKSVSGNVTIRSVAGEVRAESVSGNVVANGTGQTVHLKSVSGNVEVAAAAEGANLTLHTVAGQVTARNLRCQSIDGNTVGGDIHLLDSVCKRTSAGSMSGSIEYSGSLASGGRCELKSHSGDIRLALGPEVGFEVDASTFSGNLKTDLPVAARSRGDESRGGLHRSLRGTYGDASAFLELTTFSGNIVIVKR